MQPQNVLSVEKLSKRFGERLLFEEVTFGLSAGQKAALIARNGTGKTTLFQAITGREPADDGTVTFEAGTRWAILDQEPDLAPEKSILDNLYAGENRAVQALRDYELALAEGWEGDQLQRAYDAMDRTGGWNFEARAREVLGKLDLHDLDRVTGTLSGGERRRIALAKVLIEEPDLLLLDEPTNHLDLEMIAWLEKHLAQSSITLLMITHDRYFLENVCDTIFELDQCQLFRYKGSYAYYLEKREERIENAFTQRDKARSLFRRELEWMRATPSARTGKSKSRIDRFYEIKAQARLQLETDPMHIALNPERLGGKLVELHKVSQGFGGRVLFEGLTHHFRRSERLGIVGANGTGKSSLLDVIVGRAEPATGKTVIGETVVFGHYHQHGAQFLDDGKVIDAVRSIAEFMPLQRGAKLTAADLLERFLFPRHTHHLQISTLSGGEKKRLHLLQVLMRNPNFLILDEPTNDLDIFTLQALETFLLDFPGCLIIVSHDRYFMDRLVEHVWVLGEDGSTQVRDYPGNYTQYRLAREEMVTAQRLNREDPPSSPAPARAKDVDAHAPVSQQLKLSYKERQELEKLGPRIEELEHRKAEVSAQLTLTTDHAQLIVLSEQLQAIQEELDFSELRWLELSERDTPAQR
jgi:ATP-binding cassette subfamily F protein uup